MMDLGKADLHGILLKKAEKTAKSMGISLNRLAFLIGRAPNFFINIKEGRSCRLDLWQDAFRVLSDQALFDEREAEAMAIEERMRQRRRQLRRERKNENVVS